MVDNGWPSEWLRGVLPLCVMAIVIEDETHGYAIAQRLEREGIPNVKGGTLYPLLNRLEQDGLVTTHWTEGPSGPGRKLYRVTPAGKEWLEQQSVNWLEFSELTNALLANDMKKRRT
jgi:PadR family transcriptional regulator